MKSSAKQNETAVCTLHSLAELSVFSCNVWTAAVYTILPLLVYEVQAWSRIIATSRTADCVRISELLLLKLLL